MALFLTGMANAQSPVVWTDVVNANILYGNSLKSTSTLNWNAGAASVDVLSAGADGYVEIEAAQTNNGVMFGFSEVNTNQSWNTIDYNFYLAEWGNIRIYENGSLKLSNGGTYAVGDKMSVERVGTTIYYKHNGNVVYTSTTPSTSSLIVDCSFYQKNAILSNAVFDFYETTPPMNYCDASGNNSNYMWLDKMVVDGNWSSFSGNNGGYKYFYGSGNTYLYTLSTGSHSMDLTAGTHNDINFHVYFKAWIDFDRDGIFESNEELFTHATYGETTITNGFTIPSNAQNGATRMRIAMRYNAVPSACGNFNHGEVEDYVINISGGSGKSDNTLNEYALTEIDNNTMKLYPNHVENGSQFNIDFELIEDLTDEATIEVYNTQGQLVDVIETAILTEGKHQVQYRIDNLTTGMYFCQMRFGENAITQKLIVE